MSDKRKILIVDDEVEFTELLMMRLESEGYDVDVVGDGEAGLHAAKKIMPDIILLDVMMPKMDGFQMCRLLKLDKDLKEIPVIFLTARIQGKGQQIGLAVGANGYLVKPFENSDLINIIEKNIGV
jgi:DNA-binding response OmpR family regulator